MQYYAFMVLLGFGTRCAHSFWPPAYRVDLRDRKTFVIASDDADYDDENENEMIQPEDLVDIEYLEEDEQRYKPLHSHVERYNQRAARTATEFSDFLPYFQPNLEDIHKFVEEAKPFVAGFKHELDEYDFGDLEERVLKAVRKKRTILDASNSRTATKQSNPAKPQSHEDQRKNSPSIFEQYSAKHSGEETATASLIFPLHSPINDAGRDLRINETQRGVNSERHRIKFDENSSRAELFTTVIYDKSSEEERNTDSSSSNKDERPRALDEEPSADDEEAAGEEVYDYEKFKMEYYQQVDDSRNDSKTLNYTEGEEPEETARDALRKIVDFKKPKNCTKEELTQFGAKALECLAFDYQNARTRGGVKKVLARTWTVVRVWICIYLCIAVPCWCQKGWCCCCFRCEFCFPKKSIEAAKKYYAENPPGVLVTEPTGKTEKPTATEFKPTLFEMEAYEKLESAIRNL